MILQGLLLTDPFSRPKLGWLRVDDQRIVEVGEGAPPEKADLGDPDAIICPGFIDAHIHLPQIDSIGCDGLELLEWLEHVIFPAEIRWNDQIWAARQITVAYNRMLRAGTLGYAGYLTSHFHGYAATVRAGHALPLRALVGQTLVDRNVPAELLGQPHIRLAISQRARVTTTVNPRFAIACSDHMLSQVGLKAAGGSHVQTHLAESLAECRRVRELFPTDASYTAAYDRHGLLTDRTLLAHCVHLTDEEWRLIAQRESVVVHCPTANVFLKSGLFDLAAARVHGVRVALGSDVAAGPDIAMPRVARAMIEVAKVRAMTVTPQAYIPTPAEAWSLITKGNADALGWSDAGRLETGAMADILILKPPVEYDEHLIGRMLYTWRDDYITHRIVAGTLRAGTN